MLRVGKESPRTSALCIATGSIWTGKVASLNAPEKFAELLKLFSLSSTAVSHQTVFIARNAFLRSHPARRPVNSSECFHRTRRCSDREFDLRRAMPRVLDDVRKDAKFAHTVRTVNTLQTHTELTESSQCCTSQLENQAVITQFTTSHHLNDAPFNRQLWLNCSSTIA